MANETYHLVTEPILYRHFPATRCRDQRDAQIFLCRILARPDLALRVRSLELLNFTDKIDDEGATYPMSRPDLKRIKEAIEVLSPDTPKKWLKHIQSGDWDCIVALILTLIPNLEYFVIGSLQGDLFDGYLPCIRFVLEKAAIREFDVA